MKMASEGCALSRRLSLAASESSWLKDTHQLRRSTQRAFGVSDLPKLINFSPSHTAHSVRLASQTSGVYYFLIFRLG